MSDNTAPDDETIAACLTAIAEQRCERGTPYDAGVMAAYNAVAAIRTVARDGNSATGAA